MVRSVDAGTPLGEAAPALLRAKARPLFELEDDARGGADMDAVHDMRVASRRLREAMRLFEPLYPRREFKAWYRSIRTITRALGPVRDSDVFIDSFSRLSKELDEGGRRCVAFVVGYRSAVRERELDTLNTTLNALDLGESKLSFERLVNTPLKSSHAKQPVAEFAYREVADRAATVFAAQPGALAESNTLKQHALRIDYKRLRYAAETFAPCYGDAFGSLHETLTAFQDALGDLHDVHVFLEALRAPGLADAAARAGVSPDDIAEVDALLEWRGHETYLRFVRLVRDHPPNRLLPELLLPLVRASAADPAPWVLVAAGHDRAEETAGDDRQEAGPREIPKIALVVEFIEDTPERGAV
jgi:CHAD domain-containing protein